MLRAGSCTVYALSTQLAALSRGLWVHPGFSFSTAGPVTATAFQMSLGALCPLPAKGAWCPPGQEQVCAQTQPHWRPLPQAPSRVSPAAGTRNRAQELEAPLSHGSRAPRPRRPQSSKDLVSTAHMAFGHSRESVGAPPIGGGCLLSGLKAEIGVSSSPKQPFAPLKNTS